MARLVITYPQVQLSVVGLVSFMLSLSKYLFKTCDAVFNLQGITLNESRKLLSDYFVNQLL